MKKIFTISAFCVYGFSYAAPQGFYDSTVEPDPNHQAISQMCLEKFTNKDFAYLNHFLTKNDNNERHKDRHGWYLANICMTGALSADGSKHEIVQEWIKQYPQNTYAHMAKSLLLLNEYYSLRGTKYISQTPTAQLVLAENKLQEVVNYSNFSKQFGDTALWYQYRISVAFREPDRNNFFSIVNEGIKKYPDFIPIYSVASNSMKPEWGFSYKMFDDFALFAMNNSTYKEEIYANLYKDYVTSCCSNKILQANHFNKEIFYKGMILYTNRYPSQLNFNRFANAACLLKDKTSALYLIKEKMHLYYASLWDRNTYNECVDFLKNSQP